MPEICEQNETERIEAFNYRVFAIVITLLVLGIKVPMPAEVRVSGGLAKGWPTRP